MIELSILAASVLVIGGSTAGALVHTWRIHRRVLRLEEAQQVFEEIITCRKNRDAANTRWQKKRSFDDEIEAFTAQHTSRPRVADRFANDPVVSDELHGLSR